MQFQNLFVTSAALAFAGLWASPVMAQDNAANDVDQLEEIVVVGLRGSLQRAADIKRNSDTVVDAITMEDIGQFSDESIALAIQRIPGVQIELDDEGTGGDRVSIRGLGPEFVNSTVNGRRLLSAGTEATNLRQMNFNVFPPMVLTGVQVSKGATAARPESGLAGLVDLQTLRPLGMAQLNDASVYGSVSVAAEQEDLYDGTGTTINGLVAWRNDDSSVGGYVGAMWSETEPARDQLRVNTGTRTVRLDTTGDGVADTLLPDTRVPLSAVYNPIREDRERLAFVAGLQFEPSDEFSVLFDVLYADYDNQSFRDSNRYLLGASWNGSHVLDAGGVEIDENNVVRYVDYGFGTSTGGGPIRAQVQPFLFDNRSDNLITGINFDWNKGRLNTNLDIYYSALEYEQAFSTPSFRKNVAKPGFIYDGRGSVSALTTSDDQDTAGWAFFRSGVRPINLDSDITGIQLNFDLELDAAALSSFEFGVEYEDASIDATNAVFSNFAAVDAAQADALLAAGITGALSEGGFMSGVGGFSPTEWLVADYASLLAIDERLGYGIDQLGVDPAASHDTSEAILTGYAQLNFDTDWGSTAVTGNLGVRAVNTDFESTAATVGVGPDPVPVTVSEDYWELLPSLNLNFALRENVALRFGVAKTLSRPEYSEMAPIIQIISLPDPNDPQAQVGSAIAGNENLDPMTALNYDLTLEWYNNIGGAFVFSVFYKDVSDFIINQLVEETSVPGQSGLFNVTQPINFSDGSANGYEIGIYQPFDEWIPALEGFGVAANYTYVDSEFDLDVGDAGFGFPGSSEDNFNLTAFYENDIFTARVAYTYRSDFFRSLSGQGTQTENAIFTGEQDRMTLNLAYRPTEQWRFSLNVANVTEDPRRDFVGDESTFLSYFERGRTYNLKATYRF